MGGRAWRVYLAGVALYFLLPLEGLWSNLAFDLIGLSAVVPSWSGCAATGQPAP